MFITNDIELAAAVEHMRAAGTDLAEYELKTAAGGFPKTMPDSIPLLLMELAERSFSASAKKTASIRWASM